MIKYGEFGKATPRRFDQPCDRRVGTRQATSSRNLQIGCRFAPALYPVGSSKKTIWGALHHSDGERHRPSSGMPTNAAEDLLESM
eukprot:scaffold1372_cov351-Pavlova_lutheri.AAC.4